MLLYFEEFPLAKPIEVKSSHVPKFTSTDGRSWESWTIHIDGEPVTVYQEQTWGTRVYFQWNTKWKSFSAYDMQIFTKARFQTKKPAQT